MREILTVAVVLGGLVVVLAWLQFRHDRLTGWNPDRDTDLGPPEALRRKPFLCLEQHPNGAICGRVEGHRDNHIGGSQVWAFNTVYRQKHEFGPVGAKTTSLDAPGSPNETLPATSAPPQSESIRSRRIP